MSPNQRDNLHRGEPRATAAPAVDEDDLPDESGEIAFADWIKTLTGPTQAYLARSSGSARERATDPKVLDSLDGHASTLAQLLALTVEVRDLLVTQRTVRDFYTTSQVAMMLGKSEFTVREWCRNGRVRAQKQGSGRGKHQAWVIAHEELLRFQREGLLPVVEPK